MAPNATNFFNFYSNNHANISMHKNICHRFNNNNNNSLTLFQNRLKAVKVKFAAVNSHFIKENFFESVNDISSLANAEEKNENKWLAELRSITTLRMELIRKTLLKQSVKEKLLMWQKKRDELFQNKKLDTIFEPKFKREDILVKRENYKLIFNEIQKRTITTECPIVFDHQQRSREICWKATLSKLVLIINTINNCFSNPKLVLNIGQQLYVYRSMESRLNTLKNIKVVDEASLIAAKKLLEDLTFYKNNVVLPTQAKLETSTVKIDNTKYILRTFSINIPNKDIVKIVKRQYVALVKNNQSLLLNLTNIKQLPFIKDPTTKLFRQNVIKVVNTLVNTISSTNTTLLTEKYNKLNALLSGKLVCVANTQIMAGNNKEALTFCMETLATKIVSYAEEVISVKTQIAYDITAVITKLWSVHQQFGYILFAEMKVKCPLLAPFCYPVASSLIYEKINHKSFGYKFDLSGNVESDAKYIKRMTGIVRLYGALIVVSSKYDIPVIGLSQAWIFIAGTLNQNPVSDITATILVEFLNIVGYSMQQTYGKQYIKLLQYINTCYLKKIILVTPAGYGGPITRLNSFISKSLCIGSIEDQSFNLL